MKNFFSFLFMKNISAEARKEARVEMLINILFSTLPIWFGGVIYACISFFSNSEHTFSMFFSYISNGIIKNVSNGEFLMYAAATLGPTLYLGLSVFGRHGNEKPFPWVRPQLIIAIFINLFATVMFFSARDKGFASNELFVFFTTLIYVLCLILLFPAMAFEHSRKFPIASDAQTEDQDSYINGYREHRR